MEDKFEIVHQPRSLEQLVEFLDTEGNFDCGVTTLLGYFQKAAVSVSVTGMLRDILRYSKILIAQQYVLLHDCI